MYIRVHRFISHLARINCFNKFCSWERPVQADDWVLGKWELYSSHSPRTRGFSGLFVYFKYMMIFWHFLQLHHSAKNKYKYQYITVNTSKHQCHYDWKLRTFLESNWSPEKFLTTAVLEIILLPSPRTCFPNIITKWEFYSNNIL